MTLKLGRKHWGLWPFKVCSNDHSSYGYPYAPQMPGYLKTHIITLTFFSVNQKKKKEGKSKNIRSLECWQTIWKRLNSSFFIRFLCGLLISEHTQSPRSVKNWTGWTAWIDTHHPRSANRVSIPSLKQFSWYLADKFKMPKFSKGHTSGKIGRNFLKIQSVILFIIPYQLTKFKHLAQVVFETSYLQV